MYDFLYVVPWILILLKKDQARLIKKEKEKIFN